MPVYDTPLHTNDQSLDRVVNAGLPVALVLWDGGSALSPALEETLKQTAKQEAGGLLVARLDVADNPEAAARWSGSTPALVAYNQGTALTDAVAPLTPDLFQGYAAYLLGRGPQPVPPAAPARPVMAGNGASPASGQDLTRPVTVSDATFQQEVLSSQVPVVVDFWAPWCGPCRMIGPALENIALEMGGRVKIAKVNVDDNPQWAGQYGVQGIPTLLLVRDGQIADRIVGALPEPYLRQKIEVFAR